MDTEYVLLDRIHEGAGTFVYHAVRRADRTNVVLKLLKDELASPREIAKIRHEHAILKGLDLDGVVRPHGLAKHQGNLALVLEDFGGQALREGLRGQRLDWRTVLRIAASIAETLEAVHRRRVIHKDINPNNIVMNTETGQVKLIDFGIATRLSQEIQRAASPESLEGTLAYMSPEQTGRMNRVIDHRTDLYSLGASLYQMLTGALPFLTTDPMELIHSHIAKVPAPPHELTPEIPRVVSNIVMKLLSKGAEDRYQRASGLKADLDECLARGQEAAQIAPFPLGQRDFSDELRVPQKLYGREAELAALMAACGRVGEGAAELLLISGAGGVGKSALVHELQRSIVHRRGYFIGGKFNQLNASVPYAPLTEAFRELVRSLLTEGAEALALWKDRLLTAVGPNGQVLIDLLPEVELVIGPQAAVRELGPTEAQNRFNLVFQSFLRVFTTGTPGDPPVVLFLDDLQWVDPASLKLLQFLLTDPERANLLVIGAYRDDKVDAAHPLKLTEGELRKAGTVIREISLKPLDLPDVSRLLCDALGCDEDRVRPLSELILSRTHGNPFFVNQCLETLHQEKTLSFDERSGAWGWDLVRIEETMITDNVVTFMANKLQRLAPSTQRTLQLAACIGHRFEMKTLSIISEKSLTETAADLWDALQQGFVLPLNAEYRFLYDPEDQDVGGAPLPSAFDVSFKFLHDRVQQAAYSLIEGAYEREVHLRIGRLLLAKCGGRPGDEELLEIVNHLNLGAALITDPRERAELARLDLAAGRKAKAGCAHDAAADYFRAGMSLLDGASWEDAPELSAALHEERAVCEYLTGHLEEAEALFDVLLSRVSSSRERAHVHSLRVVLYMTMGRIAEAVSVGLLALGLFRIDLPGDEEARKAALEAELVEVQANLGGRPAGALLDLPALTDPDKKVLLKLLTSLFIPSFIVSPVLFMLIVAKHVNLSLGHGHSEVSAHGYMAYGVILASSLGRYKEAYEFGRLALDLNERSGNADQECKLNAVFVDYMHYRRPLREGLDCTMRAYHAGLSSGDFIHLSYVCTQATAIRLARGDELDVVREELSRFRTLMQRINISSTSAVQDLAMQMIANLTGDTRGRGTLSDDRFDEAKFIEASHRDGLMLVAFRYYAIKLQLLFLHGDYAGALEVAIRGEALLESCAGLFLTTELSFYTCLTLAALHPGATADEQRRYSASLAAHEAKIAVWAESCPENFRHKHLLVLAEAARISGEEIDAMNLYERAIDSARESEFIRDEALANELCAKFHLARGRTRVARTYMTGAHRAYLRWGATAKAEDIEHQHPDLLLSIGRAPAALEVRPTITSTLTRRVNGEILDVGAVIRAAQAIVGEIVLDKVLERLMRIAIENAGAQRGALILQREGRLLLEASIEAAPGAVALGLSTPIEASSDLAVSIVQYVARTKESVVLGDAASADRFAGDPYIAAHRPRSVLCLAMMHQARLMGVLYLENNATRDAFTPARLELCGLLASQAAIAIENALLYAHVEEVTTELRRANERLEDEVARRTEELRREFAERKRVEAEVANASLQEEIIRVQNERLVELSTPLIPITDRIMVMPLIGTMDAGRAGQVLEAALSGASVGRAEIVIIDITGVKRVDAEVANMLSRMAAALRMLGTGVVITGIRAEVARMLVERSIDLGDIVTCGTLQNGMAYALKRTDRGRR